MLNYDSNQVAHIVSKQLLMFISLYFLTKNVLRDCFLLYKKIIYTQINENRMVFGILFGNRKEQLFFCNFNYSLFTVFFYIFKNISRVWLY